MERINKYNFSFVAGAAMIQETVIVAKALIDNDFIWEKTKDDVMENNLLQRDKGSTSIRQFALLKQRIESLTEEQVRLLTIAMMPEKSLLVLLAIIKAHSLVYDFLVECVAVKYKALDYTLTQADYNTFISEKTLVAPEILSLSDLTAKKVRQVVFKILQQTEIIDSVKNGVIRKPYLSEEIKKVIMNDNPSIFYAFLCDVEEIRNMQI
jgi:hypothetical protein